jgi:predicted TIM-barrel fold metal-dependent hydrolase
MARTYNIVDADAHLNPPPTMWGEYLPAKYRDQAPRIEPGDDADYIVFEGARKKLNITGALAGTKAENWKAEGKLSDTARGGYEAAVRLAEMDQDGMDAQIIYGGGPLGSKNPEMFLASFDAYNRFLADFCAHDKTRLFGVGYLPMHDVPEAIRMLRDAHKLGLKAVNVPAFPFSINTLEANAKATGALGMLAMAGDPTGPRQYDNPEFYPFWEAAIELGMPITIHLGGRKVRMEADRFITDLVMSKFSMAEPIAILILNGIFQRYPELKFVSVESGVGWMPFMADYMDKTWSRHRHWTKSPLKNPPSFYMEQNVYGSFIHDAVGIATRNLPGGRNIMWSSDYPHSESTFPKSQEWIKDLFAGVPENEKNEIVGGRAKKLFNIG